MDGECDSGALSPPTLQALVPGLVLQELQDVVPSNTVRWFHGQVFKLNRQRRDFRLL